jgi:hypothetical protein
MKEGADLFRSKFPGKMEANTHLHPTDPRLAVRSVEFSLFQLFQNSQGTEIKVLQERAFPVVPHPWPDRSDIRTGQQIKHFQVADAPDGMGQIDDHTLVLDVTPKCRVGQEKMMPDKKGQLYSIINVQAHPPRNPSGYPSALLGMPSPKPFPNIMEEDAKNQDFNLVHFSGELG